MKKISFFILLFSLISPVIQAEDLVSPKQRIFNDLVQLLKGKDVLTIPQIAKKYDANEWEIDVQVVNLFDYKNLIPPNYNGEWKDYVRTYVLRDKVQNVLKKEYYLPEGEKNISDFLKQIRIQIGGGKSSIQEYFLDEIVHPDAKRKVRELLTAENNQGCLMLRLLSWQWGLFTIADWSSEIFGDVVLTLAPMELDQMIVIHISYVHA